MRHGDVVYEIVITAEIPLSILTINFWNIRIVEQLDDECVVLTFDGFPGQNIVCTHVLHNALIKLIIG